MIELAQIFILAGAILGAFFALLLSTVDSYQSRANCYLAATLFLFVLLLLRVGALVEGTLLAELMDCLRVEYLLSVGYYSYLRAAAPQRPAPFPIVLLFVPFILFSSWYSLVILGEGRVDSHLELGLEWFETIELYLVGGFFLLVLALGLPGVRDSDAPAARKQWIYATSFFLALLVSAWLLLDVLEYMFELDYRDYLTNGMALFLVGISYLGIPRLRTKAVTEGWAIPDRAAPSVRADNSGNRKSSTQHFERMQKLMVEEQLFKDPAFSRARLAAALGLSPGSITRVLKENGQTTFKEFVDAYRIALAKSLLADERFRVYSLEAVGREVGFKSRSNFYATFKKVTGWSPGAYQKQLALSGILPNR